MKELDDILYIIDKDESDPSYKQKYEFHLLGTDYSIENGYSEFYQKIEAEYTYFMQPLHHKHKVDIVLITHDNCDYSHLFVNCEEFTMHSTSSQNISYLTDGREFDRQSQFRNGAKLLHNNYVFIRSFLTGNIIVYKLGNSKLYVVGLDNHFSECKDIIENIGICRLEADQHIMLHASCCCKDDNGVVIVGDSGRGKTTLMMHLIFHGGYNFVSNDRVFIKLWNNSLHAFGAPLQLAVGLGMFREFPEVQKFLPRFLNNLIKSNDMLINKYKVRFEPCEFTSLFSGNIATQTAVKLILLPNIQLNEKSKFKKIDPHSILDRFGENILSPYDPHHPKWLGFVHTDDMNSARATNSFKQFIQKGDVHVVQVTIGYDIKNRIKNMNWKGGELFGE